MKILLHRESDPQFRINPDLLFWYHSGSLSIETRANGRIYQPSLKTALLYESPVQKIPSGRVEDSSKDCENIFVSLLKAIPF